MLKLFLSPIVIIAALGYFVDIYDLLIFSMVRVPSLREIGFGGRELEFGGILVNLQMTGLLLGGIFFGILGDKKGRLSVLFGSIILYSIANFLNGYATTFTEFCFLRFLAGFGLAGELGAGITLVAESLTPAMRGYGTMLVATIGMTGAFAASLVVQHFDWRFAYKFGGALGLVLLLLRIGVSESEIFKNTVKNASIRRGYIFDLFNNRDRFKRMFFSVIVGLPIWFSLGILATYSPEFATQFAITGPVTVAKVMFYAYIGFVSGDFASGYLSPVLKSRKRAIQIFALMNVVGTLYFLFGLHGATLSHFYGAAAFLGFSGGYWAVVVTLAAEQFGTNLRSTVATTVPNFIRFGLVGMNIAFLTLKAPMGMIGSAILVGSVVIALALFVSTRLRETFGIDLNYNE